MKKPRRQQLTTTAVPARVQMFQPTLHPRPLSGVVIDTKYGRLQVDGRLGQRHADLYEGILAYAKPSLCPETGEPFHNEVVVEVAVLRRVLSAHYSYKQMRLLAKELVNADVSIETPKFYAVGHVFDWLRQDYTEEGTALHGALRGQQRTVWRISIGPVLMEFLCHDIKRFYDPAAVARLLTGIGKAAARWILTHSRDCEPNGGWYIDTVIHAVCGSLSDSARRKRRFELRQDAEGLVKLGIDLVDDRVKFSQAERVDA